MKYQAARISDVEAKAGAAAPLDVEAISRHGRLTGRHGAFVAPGDFMVV